MNKLDASRNTLVQSFFAQAEVYPEKALLHDKWGTVWKSQTYFEVADKVLRLSSCLLKMGIKSGDRVLICSENRSEWAISDLAVMAIGGISVPAYTTNTVDDHIFILQHAEISLILCSGGSIAERLEKAVTFGKCFPRLICFDGASGNMMSFDDALADNQPLSLQSDAIKAPMASDIACLIYTSGTSGKPKGVMLTHASIQANIDAAYDLLVEGGVAENAVFMSLLPLSHAYEHTAGMHLPLQIGAEIWYCDRTDKVAQMLQEVRPTVMTAVPRLYEVLHDRIMFGVTAKGGVTERLFLRAIHLGRKKLSGKRLGFLERFQNRVLDMLVRRKVRKRFGGRLSYFVSGGAALSPEIGTFFLSLGVQILQGYGQTEASPLISANRPKKIRIETVGPAVKGVIVAATPENELIIRGDCVMKGYWRDDNATAMVLQNGWLHTGDLGKIDSDGYITIIGRKKDIIVTSGGDNIAPAKLEAALVMKPEIDQVMVYGDKMPWLSAIVVPASENNNDKAVFEDISRCISEVNQTLSKSEKIRRFLIADAPFSVENALLTPTLKIRRLAVVDAYQKQLNELYRKKGKHDEGRERA